MQCTAQYPASLEALCLRTTQPTTKHFNVPVGLSDHSNDPLIGPLKTVALGARCIEKHYTLSKRLPGPDHVFALEPSELAAMVHGIRDMEQTLGNKRKQVRVAEQE